MATNTYVALQTTTLGSNTQYVEFTSIPQTYTDLVIVCNAKDSGGGTVNTQLQVGNGSYDTAENYSWTWMGGSGSTAASGRGSNQGAILYGAIGTTSFSPAVINIQGYSNTTTYKTVIARNSLADQSSGQSVSAWVGTWRSTSAINRLRLFPGGQSFATGSTFTVYGVAAASSTQGTAKATGGTISYDQYGNVIHTFTSNGTFTPSEPLTGVEYLVVAGGGAGGTDYSGGGGAGGYLTSTNGATVNLNANAYTVTIGAGGTGGTRGNGADGGNGVASSIAGTGLTTISAAGGGGGGSYNGSSNGKTGGSGGGGAGGYGGGTPGNGGAGNTPATTPSQGYVGGRGYVPGGYEGNRYGGGGGGAAGGGANATSSAYGQGGTGAVNVISGSAATYATGGKGCESQSFNGAASGSSNTGNGGQGAGENYTGGNGGSGIVIIRYNGL